MNYKMPDLEFLSIQFCKSQFGYTLFLLENSQTVIKARYITYIKP